jgi:chemotaxis signal transduction protein
VTENTFIDNEIIENNQHLSFVLFDEEFVIPVMSIREIIEYGHLTNVPIGSRFYPRRG